MNRSKKFIVAMILGFVLSVCSAGLTLAQDKAASPAVADRGAFKGRMEAEQKKMAEELGLSPEQALKMNALRQEFMAKQKELRNELSAKQEALKDALDKEGAARASVEPLIADIKTLQGKMMDNRIDQVFKIRGILSPEQYKKLREAEEKKRAERKDKGAMKGKHKDKEAAEAKK